MQDPFIGEIALFAGNFAPVGWATCDGQLLSISQNSALFAVIGTYYGGDGVSNFALPDLRGRGPIHWGNGPGLTPRVIGEAIGTENTSILPPNLPAHVHPFAVPSTSSAQNTTASDPVGAYPGNSGTALYGTAADGKMATTNTGPNQGNGVPVSIMQPVLAITYIIALNGVFPSRP